MKFIKDVLKGMVIGIANVIPGVSGGTMAVAMGIYDKLIYSITHLRKEFKKSLVILLPLGIGMVVAIILSSKGIEYLYANLPLQTTCFFVGLILGGLPPVIKKVKGNKVKVSSVIAGLFMFILVVGMAMMGEVSGAEASLAMNVMTVLKLFGAGVIAAATMVIPGVSGSMMLMLLGYYHPVISTISETASAIFAWDVKAIMEGMFVLLPFGVGIIVGIVLIAKLIEWLFRKYLQQTLWAIIGLIAASPIAILWMGEVGRLTILSMSTALVAAVIGYVIACLLGKEE